MSDDGPVTISAPAPPSSESDPAPPTPRPRSRLRAVAGWVVFATVVVVLSVGARAVAVQTYFVPTPSMTPTLMPGDRIVVDKLASTIHRGDIVVFHSTPADRGGPSTLVKRVIGLPGETISSSGATVLIDGKPLAEPWLPPLTGDCAESGENIKTQKIGAGDYFMMGDCRGDSGDSRFFGTVPGSYVVGKVDIVIWRSGHPWIHWF